MTVVYAADIVPDSAIACSKAGGVAVQPVAPFLSHQAGEEGRMRRGAAVTLTKTHPAPAARERGRG